MNKLALILVHAGGALVLISAVCIGPGKENVAAKGTANTGVVRMVRK